MAQFAKVSFAASDYAAFRPVYPPKLFDRILNYHHSGGGLKDCAIDLGCGHGIMTRRLATDFRRVTGIDPSKGMLKVAESSTTPKDQFGHVQYVNSAAEHLPFLETGTVDLVTAGQAAHWFDTDKFWPEMARVVKGRGTVALFGYKDHVFVDFPEATKILNKYAYGTTPPHFGSYWQQPGRSRVQDKLRALEPPPTDWEGLERIEYEPAANGPLSGEGTLFMDKTMTLENCMKYVWTWSSVSAWKDAHPDRKSKESGGEGDVVDEMFEEMVAAEPAWRENPDWKQKEVKVEWGSGLVLARRRA